MPNKVEQWKQQKHGFDVWPDLLQHAQHRTPLKAIDTTDLERLKWYGVFYRKRDGQDSYMLRIRITGCELRAEQAREIAFLAYEYGHGIVDVTTRANLQVQGLKIEQVPAALKRLEDVGLTTSQTGHDNIRNVFCHPLSGVDPDELIDTRPLCRQISAAFLGSRRYADLPRKFNIALNGRAQHAALYWTQDISFLACRQEHDQAIAFQVLLGGTQGQNPRLGWHLPVLVAEDQVVAVTCALLDLFREQGTREERNRARFRFLIEQIGIGGVLEFLHQRLPFPLQPHVQPPPAPLGYEDLVGWLPQHDSRRWAMGLALPLGRVSWQQLEQLALLSKRWGSATLRTTHEQGIIIPDIRSGFRDAAATSAARCGLSVHADSLVRNTVACTGKQFCNIAVTEAKGHMFRLIEQLRQRALTLHGIRIHMSGCPSSCAGHFIADIGLKGVRVRRLLGTREGFDVFLGGGLAGQVHLALPYKLGVDVDQLPQLIEQVIQDYYCKHKPGQTFSAYWREVLRDRQAAKVADGDYLPPIWECETCQYQFQGEDPPMFCPRCAGLRRYFVRLDEAAEAAASATDSDRSVSQPTASSDNPVTVEPMLDGFGYAANDADLAEGQGLAVSLGERELALFRINGQVTALENACPHQGAPLAEGTVDEGLITCPWHGWSFHPCTGCSVDPEGHEVTRYETKVHEGKILVRLPAAEPSASSAADAGVSHPSRG